jgi:two-component system, NarL family, nitrate/nitrite response regulator NarL
MIRVVIVSDVRIYREGLAQAVREHPPMSVVGTASAYEQALDMTRSQKPDIVLLDHGIPEGVELVRQIVASLPGVHIVLLTVPNIAAEVLPYAEAGVVGYVTREESIDDLFRAIEAAQRDELCCSPQIAGALLRRISTLAAKTTESSPGISLADLTRREALVLEHIEKGLTNKEIAVTLGVEVATVKNHVHNLLAKLRVERRGEAAALFRRRSSTRQKRPASSATSTLTA